MKSQKSRDFKIYLSHEALDLIKEETYCCQIQVVREGVKSEVLKFGTQEKFFDLASLTKILFTVDATMAAVEEGRIGLSSKVSNMLAWFPHKEIEIHHLLSHSSSLKWWLPLHEKIREKLIEVNNKSHRVDESFVSSMSRAERWQCAKELLVATPLNPDQGVVYSDLDFWALGFVLEAAFEKPLLEIWRETNEKSLKVLDSVGFEKNALKDLHFSIENKPRFAREDYQKTFQNDWRGSELQGEVNDENTWALGGVAPHAGLFGSAEAVSDWALYIRAMRQGKNPYISPETLQKFGTRVGGSDWGLGFMMPGETGSTAGEKFSKTSIGHLGYTGCSLWMDFEKDFSVVLLASRKFPVNKKGLNQMRSRVHDELFEKYAKGSFVG